MTQSSENDPKRRLRKPSPELERGIEPMATSIEPFVDADNIAAFLAADRKVVIRMAREGMITAYPFSGRLRHTYKFRRSEVAADMEKIRRQSALPPVDPNSPDSSRKD
jgi:hypothetical protein